MRTLALTRKIRAVRLPPGKESDYQRRLEALDAVLQGEPITQVASAAHVSVRTVRRWVAKVHEDGVDALEPCGKTVLQRLRQEKRAQLVRDLRCSPRRFGLAADHWGGATLARHLSGSYRLRVSARHCRRILRHLGVSDSRPPKAAAPLPDPPHRAPPPVRSQSQVRHEALRRIRRLAISGLPAQAFVTTLLELIEEAIPTGPNQAFLSGPGHSMATPHLVARGFDLAASLLAYQRYGPEAGPEVSGMIRPPGPMSASRPVLRHEEVALPHFYRSAGYNEVFRPNRQHHLLSLGWLENGRSDFRCSIWRSEQMKPFTEDDARFAAAIARDIRHGLSVARAIEAPKVAAGDFVPLASPAAGFVYLSDQGRVRAMDARAEEIFRQFGAFDGHGVEVFRLDARGSAFEVIGRQLRELLFSRGYPDADARMPYEVIHSNRSGCAIKLHGIALKDEQGAGGLAVIVELGESRALLRRRVQFRYGLSPRQGEILELIARTARAGDCVRLLRIAPGTLRSHLRDLMVRLDLPGIEALRGFAQKHLAGPASNSDGLWQPQLN